MIEKQVFINQRIKEIETSFSKESKVAQRLSNPHRLIRDLQISLNQKGNRTYRGFEDVIFSSLNCAQVIVTKSNVPRALRFFDSFIKFIEKLGYKIEINGRDTICTIDGEPHQIKIKEKCNRKTFDTSKFATSHLVPNGKLSLKVVHCFDSIEWFDGRKTLEEQLSKIVASLEFRSKKEKENRIKINKYHEEQRKIQLARRIEQAKIEWESKKSELLLEDALQWDISNKLKLFINAIENEMVGEEERGQGIEDWLV